jgi:predicted nucleotidyltransferase
MASPLDALLDRLQKELAVDGVTGLALTGSRARGDAAPESDVDLLRFVDAAPRTSRDLYELRYVEGLLVSISSNTLAAKHAEMAEPETAIWAVPGLRQARALYDREGGLSALFSAARAFDWAPLRDRARDYASCELAGCAEEVHKVLSALHRPGADSTLVYASLGLAHGLGRAFAVARELLIDTENQYLDRLWESAGADSAWSRLHRATLGLEPGSPEPRARAVAGLRLYVETRTRLAGMLRHEDLKVVEGACSRVERAVSD